MRKALTKNNKDKKTAGSRSYSYFVLITKLFMMILALEMC